MSSVLSCKVQTFIWYLENWFSYGESGYVNELFESLLLLYYPLEVEFLGVKCHLLNAVVFFHPLVNL